MTISIETQMFCMDQNKLLELITRNRSIRSHFFNLDLSHQDLTNIFPEIGQLSELQHLDLSSNQLTSLPPDIGELSRLRYLDLSGNKLTSLPPEILRLTHLYKLNLSGNQLTSLPTEIGLFTSLDELNLSGNQLTSLPTEIGLLTELSKLNLGGNQFASLPTEIGLLTELSKLNLGGNQLKSLPESIWQLPKLSNLYLETNQLQNLPASIRDCVHLSILDLSNNPHLSIPPNILAEAEALDCLVITNEISKDCLLLEIIDKAARDGATRLSFFDRDLTDLPPEIGRLTNPIELDLSSNQLTCLPPEIGKLTNLIEIDLGYNQLKCLPPEIDRLSQLEVLRLEWNPLADVYTSIDLIDKGDLDGLKEILECGVDPNLSCRYDGITALGWSCCQNDLAAAQILIDFGANPNLIHQNGYSHYDSSSDEMKRLLVGSGFKFLWAWDLFASFDCLTGQNEINGVERVQMQNTGKNFKLEYKLYEFPPSAGEVRIEVDPDILSLTLKDPQARNGVYEINLPESQLLTLGIQTINFKGKVRVRLCDIDIPNFESGSAKWRSAEWIANPLP